jgi:hypothetical protein
LLLLFLFFSAELIHTSPYHSPEHLQIPGANSLSVTSLSKIKRNSFVTRKIKHSIALSELIKRFDKIIHKKV